MQKILLNLSLVSLGILIYILTIQNNQPVFEKILLCELGSAVLCFSGISILQSINDKNKEGDVSSEEIN